MAALVCFRWGSDFVHGSLIDAQLGRLPRIVTSRSQDKQQTVTQVLSKREVQIASFKMVISKLLAVETEDTEE